MIFNGVTFVFLKEDPVTVKGRAIASDCLAISICPNGFLNHGMDLLFQSIEQIADFSAAIDLAIGKIKQQLKDSKPDVEPSTLKLEGIQPG